ncbi:hypothetical protein JOD82_002107 [Paenibacillus sp. 1182]|uniref:hypothetical protein n=1 Tax=Paenibacillus sp. 1182 TaxID=2806565 RepID=UPI001AE684E9|nr:hypothetical protein [Paenibacillus sp. 1182]MBP1309087.1 hypothetical protein [Paenibacillus sp. 1182]
MFKSDDMSKHILIFLLFICFCLQCLLPGALSDGKEKLAKYEDQLTQAPIEQLDIIKYVMKSDGTLDLMVNDSHGIKKVSGVTKFEYTDKKSYMVGKYLGEESDFSGYHNVVAYINKNSDK